MGVAFLRELDFPLRMLFSNDPKKIIRPLRDTKFNSDISQESSLFRDNSNFKLKHKKLFYCEATLSPNLQIYSFTVLNWLGGFIDQNSLLKIFLISVEEKNGKILLKPGLVKRSLLRFISSAVLLGKNVLL